MDREEIARIFDEIASILELKGDNPFKIRAYLNAARQIEEADLKALIKEDQLTTLPGSAKIWPEKSQPSTAPGIWPNMKI